MTRSVDQSKAANYMITSNIESNTVIEKSP